MHVESLASKAEPGDHFVGLIGTVSDRLQYLVFEKKTFMEIQHLAFFQSRTAERLSLIRADSHDRLHKLSPELLSNVD